MARYKVLDVSKYVINRSNEKGYGISNLKLQKLLYFIQAYFLLKRGYPCFGETIEAWNFGPVIPVAYREFKMFGNTNIPNQTLDFPFLDEDLPLIDGVVDYFSDRSSMDLVWITLHQKPWMDAYSGGQISEIPIISIREYFLDNSNQ